MFLIYHDFSKKYCLSYFYVWLGKKDAAFHIIQMIYKNIDFIFKTENKHYFLKANHEIITKIWTNIIYKLKNINF